MFEGLRDAFEYVTGLKEEWDRYSNGHGGCSLYRVTAWMPIPNLYKG